ncbi:MAG: RnfABCDGE type electron transport complex subunit D [Oscillospiraceae bacterium]
MSNKLTVAPAPHIKSLATTSSIMLDVIIALIPAVIASGIFFGLRAIILIAVCVGSCVGFEYIYNMIIKKNQTVGDLSAVVTGIILALNLPSTLPLAMAIMGSFVAIVVVKCLFGGIGQNFANPAIAARVILLVSFAGPMTNFVGARGVNLDAIGGATPLGLIAKGNLEALPSYMDMFIGNIGGSLGETSALALIIGGIYLVCRKVITPTIPLAFLGTVFVLSFAFGYDPMYQILSGGVMLGAIFMATDYTTSPPTELGKIIFGIGCGVLTMLIRKFASLPEGVSYAILLMNILCPHIENLTRNRAFGGAK